jgi:hypothetical protein
MVVKVKSKPSCGKEIKKQMKLLKLQLLKLIQLLNAAE